MTASLPLALLVLPGRLTICRLPPDASPPEGLMEVSFSSFTRTADELSIVCPEGMAPAVAACESGWRALKVQGPLDFSLIGILACLSAALAEAGLSIFVISTFETDYILVKESELEAAIRALEASGHTIFQDVSAV